jgi:precorrin-6Y C5,15-methyltransferase (decarboxylating)
MRDMAGQPWLTIVGIGADGLDGLSAAARMALAQAEVIFGGPRHLALAGAGARGRPWPVPFDPTPVLALRGRAVAVLASGDPFWHGAGGTLARHLAPAEWRSFAAPSTFSLAAARLGWRIEDIACLGLHAAPFARARSALHEGARLVVLLRDGAAAGVFARWLEAAGFGPSRLHVLEDLGGAAERIRIATAAGFDLADVAAPVAIAVEAAGEGPAAGLPAPGGLPDSAFAHDGQISRHPVRALTLAALAPRPGETLWDIGAGSGSVSVEWCRAGGRAIAIERLAGRAANIAANAERFGVDDRLRVVVGAAPEACVGLPTPAAVFVGGGGNAALHAALLPLLPAGTRLVANAVTLETEALLGQLHARHGGTLLRIDIAAAEPLGAMRGWAGGRPIVQWSVVL